MHDSVERKVGEIVKRIGNIDTLTAEQDYFDAGLASVQALELLLEVESEFGVSLSDDDVSKVRNVRELVSLIAAQERA